MSPQASTVVALVPAHNEAEAIEAALHSLAGQTRRPDRVIVIADNCTDATAEIANAVGVEVVATVGNRHKKAGALNQLLGQVLPGLDDDDQILVMDADSMLDPAFIEVAHEWLGRELRGQPYGGIGGTFRGRPATADPSRPGARHLLDRWVQLVQRNEYARYARDVRRKKGKVLVLTGTATLFRVGALRDVIRARTDGRLPCAKAGPEVYDTDVLTEDNELTFALRHVGYQVRSPAGCTLTTEVMPTWGDLYRQRLRWKRGALENLRQYGLTRLTLKHWGYQVVMVMGILVTGVYLSTLVWALAVNHEVRWHLIWLAVTVVFAVERAITVRARGWRQMATASVLVVEAPFDLFLQATHAKAIFDALRGARRDW